jgi:hypothetical protein
MEFDPKVQAAMVAAVKDQDGDAALAIVEAILSGAGQDPADPTDPTTDDAAPEGGDAPPNPADGSPPVATGKLSAAFIKATGHQTEAEFLAAYKGMQDQVATLSNTQAAIALNSRRALIVELIKLGIETPALAWLGKTDEERAKRNPCARLMAEPLDEMSARIATLKKLRPAAPLPPEGGGPADDDGNSIAARVAKLTRHQLEQIKKKGMTPEQFVEESSKAVRRA